jgi:hypothetical protein
MKTLLGVLAVLLLISFCKANHNVGRGRLLNVNDTHVQWNHQNGSYGDLHYVNPRDPPVFAFFTDSNYGGTLMALPANIAISNLDDYDSTFYDSISSLARIDDSYILYVYTGVDFTGTVWGFGSPYPVPTLNPYGLNDKIRSLIIQPAPYGDGIGAGVILYEDADCLGKSIVATPGAYSPMSSAAYGTAGNFGNDKLSSYVLIGDTTVVLFKDTQFSGEGCAYTNASPVTSLCLPACMLDAASSIYVLYY